MSELALIETYREGFMGAQASLQWWASVSFGLIALASFSRGQLRLIAVGSLSFLYALFTAWTIVFTGPMVRMAGGAVRDLFALRDSGEISTAGLNIVLFAEGNGRYGFPLFVGCFFFTFIGTLAYLWYAYWKESRAGQAASLE